MRLISVYCIHHLILGSQVISTDLCRARVKALHPSLCLITFRLHIKPFLSQLKAIVFKVECFIGAINQSSYWCDILFHIHHLLMESIIFRFTNCFQSRGLAVNTHAWVGAHVANYCGFESSPCRVAVPLHHLLPIISCHLLTFANK